jgi:hypothetical protein
MSGRIVKCAATLCFAAFFATAPADTIQEWMNTAWSALTAAVEEPTSNPDEEPEVEPGGGDEGWLIDPNG